MRRRRVELCLGLSSSETIAETEQQQAQMAFAMQSMSLSMPACRPTAAFRARPSTRLGRGILRVQANVIWQLVPEPKFKLSNPEAAKKLQAIDITQQIGEKEAATVGTEKVDEVRPGH